MKARLKPLSEQVVVVTGASSGIGLLIARGAARRGAKVLLISRNAEVLGSIVAEIEQEGGAAVFAAADVADAAAVEAAADLAIARFGKIDCWVNNAGVAIYAKLVETPDDEHERLFATNYFGVVHGSRSAIRRMRSSGGALITIASIASDMPSPVLGAYAASKHAVKAYVESLRIELAAENIPISVTLIKPAGMATPIAIHAANHMRDGAKVPPPAYDPQVVADAVLHCAEHPLREATVGGIGRAQTLFAQHFPSLFDRLAPLVIPFLTSRRIAKSPENSLWSAGNDGAVRSPYEAGLSVSPYTALVLRPKLTKSLLAAVILAMAAWTARVNLKARSPGR